MGPDLFRATREKVTIVQKELSQHLKSIWRFAYALSGSADMAEDLTQATALRALEKQEQFKGGNLAAWCMTICRSIWLNERRSAALRSHQSLSLVPEDSLKDEKPSSEENIFTSQVLKQVMALPEAQRETLTLVYIQGFAYREAAEILDVPIGTVMSRLAAARTRLVTWGEDAPADGAKQ